METLLFVIEYHIMNLNSRKSLVTLFVLILTLFLFGCGRLSAPVAKSGFYFDTFITVTIYDIRDPSEAHLDQVFATLFSEADRYEHLFSRTLPDSDLYRINAAKGETTEVDPETALLLETALNFAEKTGGRIDPSIGAVSSLWDFHMEQEPKLPDQDKITSALSHVDYTKIHVEHEGDHAYVRTEDPEMILDLGFIAKGYIADRMKELLAAEGVSSAIINLGANILVVGKKPEGKPFQVGVQKPFGNTGEILTKASVSDASVVSSGNYERYFILNDILYHHILDTATGYPADTGLTETTIFCPDSTTADALSTTCFLLGEEEGKKLIEELNAEGYEKGGRIEAIFVRTDGSISMTEGLSEPLEYLR